MSTKEKIFEYIKENSPTSSRDISAIYNLSRQAINKHIRQLIQEELIVKQGSARSTVYCIASKDNKPEQKKQFKKTYALSGLEEDVVYSEMAIVLNVNKAVSSNVSEIIQYAFTEILNNAIDHSLSDKCSIEATIDQYSFNFCVRDFGIGVFYTIFDKFNLSDENAAIGELIKGKTTTMQERHSGEGIFFTSKAADKMLFRSHKIRLLFDNPQKDIFVEEVRYIKGTEARFNISRRSKKRLARLFAQYAPEEFDFRFEKTRAMVKLFYRNYISRSEAKRLLIGLDKFQEITLDFKDVKSIGQGFTDEIFRVFQKIHPEIVIKTENLSPVIAPMISHIVDN